ncbi:hypothetical protein GS506_04775 [Rhodococcus hoagii]|nr:hypothetical protein [Prescottella equi]
MCARTGDRGDHFCLVAHRWQVFRSVELDENQSTVLTKCVNSVDEMESRGRSDRSRSSRLPARGRGGGAPTGETEPIAATMTACP